jgi:hypothetical protein
MAHDAFGDLGPFYAGLLHPLVDPTQTLMLAAVGVLLASQTHATVRPAYAAACLAGVAATLAAAALPLPPPDLRTAALASAALCVVALAGMRVGVWPASLLAAAMTAAAAFALDAGDGTRAVALGALGAAVGIAAVTLLAWGLVDEARRRLGPVAPAVAAAWVVAAGVMAAALPA